MITIIITIISLIILLIIITIILWWYRGLNAKTYLRRMVWGNWVELGGIRVLRWFEQNWISCDVNSCELTRRGNISTGVTLHYLQALHCYPVDCFSRSTHAEQTTNGKTLHILQGYKNLRFWNPSLISCILACAKCMRIASRMQATAGACRRIRWDLFDFSEDPGAFSSPG